MIQQEVLPDGRVATVSGTGEARVQEVRLLHTDGRPADTAEVGEPLLLEVRIRAHEPVPRLVLGFLLKDRLGQAIYGINTHRLGRPLEHLCVGEEATFRFRFPARLGKGSYSVSLSLSREDSHLDKNFEWRDNALIFHVFNTRQEDFVGSSWLDAKVEIERMPVSRPAAT
jgi:lipopolysaccharide transport system ATP-binding protein